MDNQITRPAPKLLEALSKNVTPTRLGHYFVSCLRNSADIILYHVCATSDAQTVLTLFCIMFAQLS